MVVRQVPALPPLCGDLGQVPGARFVRKNCGYAKTTQRAAFCSTAPFISVGLRCQKAVKAAVPACLLREIPTAWTHLGLGGSWVGSAPMSCRQRGSLGFPARFWREDGEQDFSPCYALVPVPVPVAVPVPAVPLRGNRDGLTQRRRLRLAEEQRSGIPGTRREWSRWALQAAKSNRTEIMSPGKDGGKLQKYFPLHPYAKLGCEA